MERIDSRPEEIRHRNQMVLKSALKLNLVDLSAMPRSRRPSVETMAEALSKTMCQAEVARERSLIAKGVGRMFRKVLGRGKKIYFVTVVNPTGIVTPGKLTAEHFKKVREETQRNARKLISHGRYLAFGVVDISYNTDALGGEEPHWQLHAHLLVYCAAPEGYDVAQLLRDVFKPKMKSFLPKAKPVVVKNVETLKDLRKIREYISSKLLADCNQARNIYLNDAGERSSKDRPLRPAQFDELLSVIAEIGPQKREILCGLRRRADRFERLAQSAKRKRVFKYQCPKLHSMCDDEITRDSYYSF